MRNISTDTNHLDTHTRQNPSDEHHGATTTRLISSPSSIFISYRRCDSRHVTGRIYDHLEHHFGREQVFMDVNSIPPGVRFPQYLDRSAGCCRVLLAVIGPTWLTATDHLDQRRLDLPNDWVRQEIETAIRRGIPVIPVLVNGAQMPRPASLPEGLKALSERQSTDIRCDPHFKRDIKSLIQDIEVLLAQWR